MAATIPAIADVALGHSTLDNEIKKTRCRNPSGNLV
jgi:hypothetical protein